MVFEAACEPAERKLVVAGQVVASEPAQLRDVIGRHELGLVAGEGCFPHEIEGDRRILAVAVAIRIGVDEVSDFDRDARLLADLPPEPGQGMLVLLEEATERVPEPGIGFVCAPREEDTTGIVDHERRYCRKRVRVALEPAAGALDLRAVVRQLGTAARTEPPASENPHVGTVLPCLLDTFRRP